MPKETERRFLPAPDFDPAAIATETLVIRQSYINVGQGLVVRLRETLQPGTVTHTAEIEKPGNHRIVYDLETKRRETDMTNSGERQVLHKGMYHSLRTIAGPEIVKLRHLVPHGGRTWEVDVYVRGRTDVPMIAEIEFDEEADSNNISIPEWAGTEVTGDRRYSNESIAASMEGAE